MRELPVVETCRGHGNRCALPTASWKPLHGSHSSHNADGGLLKIFPAAKKTLRGVLSLWRALGVAGRPETPFLALSGVLLALSWPLLAQETQDAGTVLRVAAAEDQIIQIRAKTRHTTVIVLPAKENILDFVVGDSEYWHLTGAAHLAFLKPIAEGVRTNVALVCESGKIYSFLVSEHSAGEPHLVVRIEAEDAGEGSATPSGHEPAFVARRQVAAYQQMAESAIETAKAAQVEAESRIAEAAAAETRKTEAFRSAYPTRLKFPYRLEDKARQWPFLIEGMWHDGQFTYLRSKAQESPALYEVKDGKPALVAYDLQEDGLYIARHVLGHGWLQIGKKKVRWRFSAPEIGP